VHTFGDLMDAWNHPDATGQAPSWISENALVDVPAHATGTLGSTVVSAGAYAFHCGYLDAASGKVVGFWHSLHAA
jgi:hypothetical protein